jgi:hypothetical protein
MLTEQHSKHEYWEYVDKFCHRVNHSGMKVVNPLYCAMRLSVATSQYRSAAN